MMKISKILALFLIPLLLSTSFKNQQSKWTYSENKWSGTVSWFQKKTGPEISLSEWKMEAFLTNDTGRAVHSSRVVTKRGDVSDCRTEGKAELSVGIDKEAGEYSIEVLMPGCSGTVMYYYGKTEEYSVTDETAIIIPNQRLGGNQNSLSGFLVEYDTTGVRSSTTVTTYRWNLTKSK